MHAASLGHTANDPILIAVANSADDSIMNFIQIRLQCWTRAVRAGARRGVSSGTAAAAGCQPSPAGRSPSGCRLKRAHGHPTARDARRLERANSSSISLSIPPSQWSGAGGTASAMTYAKTHSHAASANISKTSAADCPRGHLATAAASAWHRCMLPLLLSCMIGAGGRSNMLGSCAADHPKRRVLVAASASAPTQAAALDLVLGSADPHSPLRSSAADRPNRRDARRRRCIGSASIKAAALACTTTIALVTG